MNSPKSCGACLSLLRWRRNKKTACCRVFNANVVNGVDGGKWIFSCRSKTNTPSKIPLLPISNSIVNKYVGSSLTANSGKASADHEQSTDEQLPQGTCRPLRHSKRTYLPLREAYICYHGNIDQRGFLLRRWARCWVIKVLKPLSIMRRLLIRKWVRIWRFWRVSTAR